MCNNFSHLCNPEYDVIRKWIIKRFNDGKDWSWFNRPSRQSVAMWLEDRHDSDDWPLITEGEWSYMVSSIKEGVERNLLDQKSRGMAIIVGDSDENNLGIPTEDNGSWQLYKQHLSNSGFSTQSIASIETSAHNILKRISRDTKQTGPVKGLVIGNVQSGKTANMAALMAMAADHGWNMFIILSGTTENLRLQTEERLKRDLICPGSCRSWISLGKLCRTSRKKQCPTGQEPTSLHMTSTSPQRYFTVCLKNAVRLLDLYKWLCWEPNVQKNMKVLIIDDECDQASINTATDPAVRTSINRTICNMVNNGGYSAMNYVGYTATPYANILNETRPESLYPKDFILTLPVSNEYFGPQQIFGCEDTEYEGMDISRIVSPEEIAEFKDIHKGNSSYLPKSLKKSICWFLCSVAAMRKDGYKKPISLLIHTSQKIEHHDRITNIVQDWLNNTPNATILRECRRVWDEETNAFTRDNFIESYKKYNDKESVSQYPKFDEIEDGIKVLLSRTVDPVQFGSDEQLDYHDGLHLCVDNSANNPTAGSYENWRLCYPSPNAMPSPAPAFIVIGGTTLSRGLTIEGLVCTFFLREVGTADTLMQMGRWFGYRRKYELYPRIWMSAKTNEKFSALSVLDHDLREEINWMSVTGNSPKHYAAKLDYFRIIQLAGRNRIQGVVVSDMDFSGSFKQTYLFDDDRDILVSNLRTTEGFINSLGEPEKCNPINAHAENCRIWRGVQLDNVLSFLENFKFHSKLTIFNDLTPFIDWVKNITENGDLKDWNVILAGKSSGPVVDFAHCSTTKVERTRKAKVNLPGTINIGVLRAPSDIIADIDLSTQDQRFVQQFANEKGRETLYKKLRHDAGLGKVPQLIIYIVDKDSQASQKSIDAGTRQHLNAPEDIVGICLNVPGAPRNGSAISKVHALLMTEDGDDVE